MKYNPHSIGYGDLGKVPEHLHQIIKHLVDELVRYFGEDLYSVILYGSIARGDWRNDSDIDILIIADNLPRSRLDRQRIFIEIEQYLEDEVKRLWDSGYYHDFSPILKTPEEAKRFSPLYLDMVEDAVILYDKNNFFRKILDRLTKILSKLGAKRVRIGNYWIWDLKPDYTFGEVISIE